MFWLQLEFLFIRWPFNIGINLFYGTRHGSWFLIGPAFYCYLKALLGQNFVRSDYLYFAPFLLFTVLFPLVFEDFLTFRQIHYGMLTPFDSRPDQINTLQYLYSFVFVGQFFYLIFFIWKGKVLISDYQRSMQIASSNLPEREMRWLYILWYGMLLIFMLASLLIVLLFFTDIYRRHMDYLYVIPSSLLFYALSYRLIGVQFEKPNDVPKYEKSGLKQAEVTDYVQQIKRVIEGEKLYLQQGLRLKDLSEKLQIPPYQLSEVMNLHMSTTFFDLINHYRVQEAKERIQSNPEHTLLQIAYDSGFNNKTSFVNAFKRFEGTTPSRFMRKSA